MSSDLGRCVTWTHKWIAVSGRFFLHCADALCLFLSEVLLALPAGEQLVEGDVLLSYGEEVQDQGCGYREPEKGRPKLQLV